MKTKDIPMLAKIMEDQSLITNKDVTERLVDLYYNLLIEFSIEDIYEAFRKHTMESNQKHFFPKPGNISDLIKGTDKQTALTPDDIVNLAREKKTPVGVIAAFFITSFDLLNQNDYYLRNRAKDFLFGIQEILDRGVSGNYTPVELQLMEKYGVDPLDPPAPGFPMPKIKMPDLKSIPENKKELSHAN
jgi:hypothetical protein